MKKGMCFLALLGLAFLLACGGGGGGGGAIQNPAGEKDQISSRIRLFMGAFQKGDTAVMNSVFSPRMQVLSNSGDTLKTLTVCDLGTDLNISSDDATYTFFLDTDQIVLTSSDLAIICTYFQFPNASMLILEFHMIKEQGNWLIDFIDVKQKNPLDTSSGVILSAAAMPLSQNNQWSFLQIPAGGLGSSKTGEYQVFSLNSLPTEDAVGRKIYALETYRYTGPVNFDPSPYAISSGSTPFGRTSEGLSILKDRVMQVSPNVQPPHTLFDVIDGSGRGRLRFSNTHGLWIFGADTSFNEGNPWILMGVFAKKGTQQAQTITFVGPEGKPLSGKAVSTDMGTFQLQMPWGPAEAIRLDISLEIPELGKSLLESWFLIPGIGLAGFARADPVTKKWLEYSFMVEGNVGGTIFRNPQIQALSGILRIEDSYPLPAIVFGKPFSHQFKAIGGTQPLTWAMPSGPSWMKLSATGLAEGVPAVTGSFSLSISFKDAKGAGVERNLVWFVTPSGENTLPALVTATPASGSILANLNTPLVLTFSESMLPQSVIDAVSAKNASGQAVALKTPEITLNQTQFSFAPALYWPRAGNVDISITGGASSPKDLAGNSMAQGSNWTFAIASSSGPIIAQLVPASGASLVAQESKISITFSEPIAPLTASGNIFIVDESGASVSLNPFEFSTDQKTIFCPPVLPLKATTVFTVTMKGGESGIHSLTGFPLASDEVWKFTTERAGAIRLVTSTKPDGLYPWGTKIDIFVEFQKGVKVTGSPTLLLETGTIDRIATFTSASGTNTLVFTYNVEPGDTSKDLDYASDSALSLNGGTITNLYGEAVTPLTLPTPGQPGSLAANKALVIDGSAPTVTINQAADQKDPTGLSPVKFTVVFSKKVVSFDPSGVTLGGTASASKAVVTSMPPNDGTIWQVAISGMTSDGTIIPTITASRAFDLSGNGNLPSTSTDNVVTRKSTIKPIFSGHLGGNPAGFYTSFRKVFYMAWGSAIDSAGNIYITDSAYHRVQKYDASGNLVKQWGALGTGNSQFDAPHGIAVDLADNVYVADTNNSRIQKFDSSGGFLLSFGSKGSGDGQFSNPYDVSVDMDGNIFVADTGNNRIQMFNSAGNYIFQTDGTAFGGTAFNGPRGVTCSKSAPQILVADTGNNLIRVMYTNDGIADAVTPGGGFNQPSKAIYDDSGSNFYIADTSNSLIKKCDSAFSSTVSIITSGSGNGRVIDPVGLSIDASGNLWVVEYAGGRVQKFSAAGIFLEQWGSKGDGDGMFDISGSPEADSAGNIFVTDQYNNRVQKFNSSGVFLAKWGIGGGSGPGQMQDPSELVVDAAGNVYVGEYNNRVVKFSNDLTFLTSWGSPGSGDGQFSGVWGIARDTAGNLYVAEGNHRVQKFTADGGFMTKWGSLGSGDGQFDTPSGIAVDANGLVYVSDSKNNRVQKFTSDGVFLTKWGSAGTGNGQFTQPYGVAVDSSGNVFVVDHDNHRIQKFTPDGTFLLEFGSRGSGNEQFHDPESISIDAMGNLYVGDTENNTVERFTLE